MTQDKTRHKVQAAPPPVVAIPACGGDRRPPTGYIEGQWDDAREVMAYWLPVGVTAESIGIRHGRSM